MGSDFEEEIFRRLRENAGRRPWDEVLEEMGVTKSAYYHILKRRGLALRREPANPSEGPTEGLLRALLDETAQLRKKNEELTAEIEGLRRKLTEGN